MSFRLMELRHTKTKKMLGLERLQKQAGENWRNSRFSYAISGVRTNLHHIGKNIQDTLDAIDRMVCLGSHLHNRHNEFTDNYKLDLSKQDNYHCLLGVSNASLKKHGLQAYAYPRFLKQKSPEWFDKRNKAKVTGRTSSTMNAT